MLPEIRIASPCTADWDRMLGDDRVRYCERCRLNVYNFSAMTSPEVERILANRSGRLCARLYRRADGTILTQDCPVGFRAAVRRVSRVAGAALTAVMSVGWAAAQNAPNVDNLSLVQIQSGEAGVVITVTDPTGAVIPNAAVSLFKEGTTLSKIDGVTDSSGVFRKTHLSPGAYTITIHAPGFATVQTSRTLGQGELAPLAVDLSLSLAVMGEVVEVDGPVPEAPQGGKIPDFLPMPKDSPEYTLSSNPTPTPRKDFFARLVHKLGF
jgi:hypothetical protein